jgi:hypothetical protein
MHLRSAVPSSVGLHAAAVSSWGVLESRSVEGSNGAVVAMNLDRYWGDGALVEGAAVGIRIVCRDSLADGLPRRFDGLEGLDVEGRVGCGDVIDGGGEEIGGFEDCKVALGFPTAP